MLVLPRRESLVICLPPLDRVRFLVAMLGRWSAVFVWRWCGQTMEQASFLYDRRCCEVLGVKWWLQSFRNGVVKAGPWCVRLCPMEIPRGVGHQLWFDFVPFHRQPPQSFAMYDATVLCVHDDGVNAELSR